jgi:hypothetical protein
MFVASPFCSSTWYACFPPRLAPRGGFLRIHAEAYEAGNEVKLQRLFANMPGSVLFASLMK